MEKLKLKPVALEERSEESVGFIVWGPWISVLNLMDIHPIIVEEKQKGQSEVDNHLALNVRYNNVNESDPRRQLIN